MSQDVAQRFLKEAYAELDEGRLLRRVLKRQRQQGLDPPMGVQYVGEPHLVALGNLLGFDVHADILLYEAFEGADACADVFEEVLEEALRERLEPKIRRWNKQHAP